MFLLQWKRSSCAKTIANLRRALQLGRPIFGICLGHQLLALAAGANTYKLKFGHRRSSGCAAAPAGRAGS
jgi:carbamoylphosphate synthase small subunit